MQRIIIKIIIKERKDILILIKKNIKKARIKFIINIHQILSLK